MSEFRCQAPVRLLHVHDFGVCSQNVELPKPGMKEAIVWRLNTLQSEKWINNVCMCV